MTTPAYLRSTVSPRILYAALGSSAVVALLRYWYRRSAGRIYPPSPRSYPLIGNLLSIPSGTERVVYMILGQQLKSDMVFLELLGNTVLVLNSSQAAMDLLDKRSSIYSDRPPIPMINDPRLYDWSGFVPFIGYNDLWRWHRRMFNHLLNPRAASQYHELQERQARLLLRRLMDASAGTQLFEDVRSAFFFTQSSSMSELAYGYRFQSNQDPLFIDTQATFEKVADSLLYSNFLVNLFPSLSLVPEWFPGAGWKQVIRKRREQKERVLNEPYKWMIKQVTAGVAERSVLGELWQDHHLTSELETNDKDTRLKEVGVSMQGGGTDTTSNTLMGFVAAMVLNPHVQAKAQSEIDTVLGPFTLPSISDQERLPYVRNVVLEILRWCPAIPIGIPHTNTQDDEYRGYSIPKGTIIIGNLWAMSRDKDVYQDPDTFNPDRFFDPNVPELPVFGWGRRKCPGLHFAEASLFLAISSILATLTFTRKVDSNGQTVAPNIEFEPNSMALRVCPFEFELKPRSGKHRELLT